MFEWNIATEILKSPNTLIAGATGSGKSTCLNTIICQALQEPPTNTKMVLIDLKRVELAKFSQVPHCIRLITEPSDVIYALDGVLDGVNYRYKTMPQGTYQSDGPHVYLIIDELAYTIRIKGVLDKLTDIGRLGRAANVHLICATQDPSRNTLKAQLMQNFTNVVALRCRSAIESRQAIGVPGAEDLPPHGRALYSNLDGVRSVEIPMLLESDVSAFIKDVENSMPKPITENLNKYGKLGCSYKKDYCYPTDGPVFRK